MRHRKVSFIATVVRHAHAFPITRERLLFLAILVAGLWMAWSLLQQVILTQQLAHDAGAVRQQNAALRASNQGYRHDIAAVTSGASAEEDARLHGYARPGESAYLVASQQSQAAGGDRSAPPPAHAPQNPLQRAWAWIASHAPA
jgi:cell division protein FtsB